MQECTFPKVLGIVFGAEPQYVTNDIEVGFRGRRLKESAGIYVKISQGTACTSSEKATHSGSNMALKKAVNASVES